MDIEQLFRKVANDFPGKTELVMANPDGSINVNFINEENVLAAKVRLKMVSNSAGIPLVSVKNRQDKKDLEVLVSPIPSAVIAVCLR